MKENNKFVVHLMISLSIVMIGRISTTNIEDVFLLNMTVKGYHSNKEDQIIFIQFQLPDEELTIIGYTPLVVTPTAHHMNTMACQQPFSNESLWTEGLSCGPGAAMLLYGWDRDALPFRFPQDIGVLVGKNTPYKYIVINIHYLPIVHNDYSGNQFIFTRKRRKYLAGVVTGGPIPFTLPPSTSNVKTPFSCQYHGVKLSIFAVGIHAHQWGRINSLYRVRNGHLTLIAKVNPQEFHQTYQLSSRIEIQDGDYLIGQCLFDNNENRTISTGLTHKDEMCNFMAGYIYDNLQTNGQIPLEYCWGNLFPQLTNLIPIVEQSSETHVYKSLIISIIILLMMIIMVLICRFIVYTNVNSKRIDGFQPIEQVSDEEL